VFLSVLKVCKGKERGKNVSKAGRNKKIETNRKVEERNRKINYRVIGVK
jgi:hypothetical protein